jgi:hypothetical protein
MTDINKFTETKASPVLRIPEDLEPLFQPLFERRLKKLPKEFTKEKVKELIQRSYSYYLKYKREDDRLSLRYAAGIAFVLRDLAYQGKIKIDESDILKFNTIVGENCNDYIRSIYGPVI